MLRQFESFKTFIEHEYIRTNEINLHVVEAGRPNGPPVILLHGFPEFWYGWRHQIDFLVHEGYRLIIPDQRGYNLSEKPAGILSYRNEKLVADILGILDSKQLDRVFLIGHDWGGIVAWYLAMRYPERFFCLINMNIPHPLVMKQTLLSSREQRKKSWYIFFFQLPRLPEYLLSRKNYNNLKKMLRSPPKYNSLSAEDIKSYVSSWQQPGAVRSMINWYRAAFLIMTQQRRDATVKIPTLLIWGKKDVALGHQMAQPSIDLCENGRLVFFEEASHWIQHEEHRKVNQLIKQFIEVFV